MKAVLEDVVHAIENTSDRSRWFYVKADEEIVEIKGDDMPYEENEVIALPDRRDVDDYGNMERFIEKVDDDTIHEWLSNAIKGRGAFRMFRAALERFHMLNEWYDYRDRCHRVLAMDWCEENGIEYEGSRYVSDDYYDDFEDEEEDDWVKETPLPKKPAVVKPDYKIIQIGRKNVSQLIFLASDFTDERLKQKGYPKADDPDAASERLEEALNDGCMIRALSDHGRFIAYSIASEGAALYIDEIYVKPELRRKGLGRMLVNQAEKDAEERGTALQFAVSAAEHDFIRFLQKCGYNVLRSLTIAKEDVSAAYEAIEIDGIPFRIR